ncbi:hypothetical protein RhiJN_10459 [Ceratobasidium sp. AG-Ba]|nr:hypothetical protein RhiJN_10459 [Ceratobasidium sp. AG-Ba]QRW11188.1 hypothetical protein RhiLY_10187 [Ceratobasidium sp. AG-Ba]
MSTYIVQSGDVLLIPAQGLTAVTVEWRQNLSNKKASYHTGMVNVKDKVGSGQVPIFVQSEWYQDAGHMSRVSTKAGDCYELRIGCEARYGQKNAQGEGRFVVYHDTSRNPFQHRFVKSALLSMATDQVRKFVEELKVPRAEDAISLSESLFGDALRAF